MSDKEMLELAIKHRGELMEVIKNAPISSGYCCCGDPMELHSFGTGHSPVDEWDNAVINMINRINEEIDGLI